MHQALSNLGDLSSKINFTKLSTDLSSGLSTDVSTGLIASVVEALVTASAGALSATLEVLLRLS